MSEPNTETEETQPLTGGFGAQMNVPASAVFFVCALACHLFSSIVMIPIAAAKADGSEMTWGVAFLPLWISDALVSLAPLYPALLKCLPTQVTDV